MCPSWPKEHDWKSCKRKTRFKSSNLFICAIVAASGISLAAVFITCVLDAVLENGIGGFDEQKLYDMITFANAASAVITTRRGALKVMPVKAEVYNI